MAMPPDEKRTFKEFKYVLSGRLPAAIAAKQTFGKNQRIAGN
ncbi:MAG: hypothetical protein V1493_04780 [Candidatus Diapherotrites archaeon]